MKVFKLNKMVTVILDDGNTLTLNDCTQEKYNQIISANNDEEAKKIILGNLEVGLYNDCIEESQVIVQRGNSAYIPSISELTVPQDLVTEILKAEKNGDYDTLNSYLNFWTLVSLNPDSRVRNNIFWFLKRWNVKITRSGLLVAYRNVDKHSEGAKYPHELIEFISVKRSHIKHVTKSSPKYYYVYKDLDEAYYVSKNDNLCDHFVGNLEELYQDIISEDSKDDVPVYTDHHTHTFRIKLGHIVTMPREKCDSIQENSCSRGLHCAGKDWLEKNYFGTVGLRVLVNPADVVAIPTIDNYGKLRTCAYYPLDIVEFDEHGKVIDEGIDMGMEDDFLNKICYKGEINNEDNDNYTLSIPEYMEINKDVIDQNLINIAKRINRFV